MQFVLELWNRCLAPGARLLGGLGALPRVGAEATAGLRAARPVDPLQRSRAGDSGQAREAAGAGRGVDRGGGPGRLVGA
eukprot:6469410-Lingulodinium_polyedra.AAC.1